MELYEKLLDIQNKLVVAKSKYNEFGNFSYRSCEDILQAVKPLLKEHNIILLLKDEVQFIGDKHYIKATATLTDVQQVIETTAFAREPASPKAKMDDSQTTGSTSSYARKYALNGLFALDDNADSDKTNNGKENKDKTTKLITKVQIEELKKLGFDDVRLGKMVKYYKLNKLEEVTFKQAEETIKKTKKAQLKAKEGEKNEKN